MTVLMSFKKADIVVLKSKKWMEDGSQEQGNLDGAQSDWPDRAVWHTHTSSYPEHIRVSS
jgi:hypothetical protein